MLDKGEIIAALTEFVKQKSVSKNSIICKVKEYNSVKKTCYCEPIGDFADIQQVRIIADASKDGFLIVPKVDSVVMVSLTGDNSGYISMFSEVDEIRLAGNNYGGVPVSDDLVTRFNNLENAFNTHLTNYNLHTHAGVTVGVGVTAIPVVPDTGNVSLTTSVMIESTTVYHGDGL